MAPSAWPQRGQMFIANVATSAFFSSVGAQCVASRTNISLRWSEEVPLGYRFYKHLAALQPGRSDTNCSANFRVRTLDEIRRGLSQMNGLPSNRQGLDASFINF